MVTSIPFGIPTAVSQTTAYALPPTVCSLISTVAVEVSADGTTYVTLPSSTTGAVTGATFVRCTTAPAVLICRKY